jgi:hypothetical protein
MNNPYNEAAEYQFWFFLMQPVAITIEDLVCFSCRGLGYWRLVGYFWVFAFLSFSLRYMAAYFYACGFADLEHPLTKVFSVARYLLANDLATI